MRLFASLCLSSFLLAAPAGAQEQTPFARNSITIYVGNTAGGTYDL